MLSQPFHRQLGSLLFVDVAIQQLEIAKSMSTITEVFDPVFADFYLGESGPSEAAGREYVVYMKPITRIDKRE